MKKYHAMLISLSFNNHHSSVIYCHKLYFVFHICKVFSNLLCKLFVLHVLSICKDLDIGFDVVGDLQR